MNLPLPSKRYLNLRPWLSGLGILVVLISLVRWGGTATPGPLFVLGVAVMLGLMTLFALLVWRLLLSPMSEAIPKSSVTPALRETIGSLAVVSGLMFSVGLVWDETWHRRYGGFGDDFLWPPHFLIYGSLGLNFLFALGGMLWLWRKGQGNLRQRFRAEPLVGLLALMSGYLVLSAPLDELWHRIYGKDITAWSLPHLTLFGGMAVVLMVSVTMLLSNLPRASWQGLRGLRFQEGLAILLFVFALSLFTQIGTAEWEGIRAIATNPQDTYRSAFWSRPEWLYPVVVATVAFLVGSIALYTLKRVGVATLIALGVVGLRMANLEVFAAREVGLGFFSYALLVPALLALDVAYALALRRSNDLEWSLGRSLSVAAIFLLMALPLIAEFLVYPRVNADTLPGMVGMGLLMALAASWFGSQVGNWLGGFGRSAAVVVKTASSRLAPIALAVALSLLVLDITLAKPPLSDWSFLERHAEEGLKQQQNK